MSENLENIMGEFIFDRFTRLYYKIAYGEDSNVGYGNMLYLIVNPIIDWYKDNKELMDTFIANNPENSYSKIWKEFKEMFIDINGKVSIILFNHIGRNVGKNGLYNAWKSYNENESIKPIIPENMHAYRKK